MTTFNNLTKIDEIPLKDATLYKTRVGGLQFYILTHPYVSFGVNKQYNQVIFIEWMGGC